MILIKDGLVIDPKTGTDDVLDIILEGDRIYKIGKYQRTEEFERIIEAGGMIVAPGLIDVHVHFRDPGLTYKEDIETGAKAAAKGGFTTVVCMANTKPPVDNAETLQYVLEKGKQTGIRVLTVANITKGMQGREMTDMEELAGLGAAGFSDDGVPLMDEKLAVEAMRRAKELNLPLSLHEEDPAFIESSGVNRGAVSEKLGVGGASAVAEDVLVARDCVLALHTGACVNFQHLSSAVSVELVRNAKKLGANVFAEATPQHFSLDEEAVLKRGTLAKVNPPLRTKRDRYEIIEGLKDGTIDVIATDHAPHSREEKAKPLTEAPSGMIGLETSLALGITNLVRKGHLTMAQLLRKMTVNPAALYHLDSGSIEEGAKADLVLYNESERWVVSDFVSRSCNSPFVGETLYGKVKYTICGGKIVYEDSEKPEGLPNAGAASVTREIASLDELKKNL